jgi:hypothetical protein
LADGSNVRPQLIFLDDAQTSRTAADPQQTENLIQNIERDLIPLMQGSKRSNMIFCGTVIEQNDIVSQFIADKRFAYRFIAKSVEKMPSNLNAWEDWVEDYKTNGKESALQYYRENEKKLLEGAVWNEVSYHRERFTSALQALMFEYFTTPEAFYSERQNSPLERRLVGSEEISDNIIEIEENNSTFYCGIDIHDDILFFSIISLQDNNPFLYAAGVFPHQNIKAAKSDMTAYRVMPKYKVLPLEKQLKAALTDLIMVLNERYNPKMILIDGRYQARVIEEVSESYNNVYRTLGVSTNTNSGLGYFKKKAGDEIGNLWALKRVRGMKKRSIYLDTNEIKGTIVYAGFNHVPDIDRLVIQSIRMSEAGKRVEKPTGKGWQWKEVGVYENHFLDSFVYALGGSIIAQESKTEFNKIDYAQLNKIK